MVDVETSAAFLYDGGWRAEDKGELMQEYELTAEEADRLCEELKKLDQKVGS